MLARLLILLALAAATPAEIIDRVAATAGRRVITESDIDKEIRLSAFVNGAQPDFSAASRQKTAERLVERALMENEMEIGQYPTPEPSDVEDELADLRKERGGPEGYAKALAAYGLADSGVGQYLLKQQAVLGFIDARFGPGVQVLEEDIRAYYSGPFRKQWDDESRKPLPAFEDVRSDIEEILHEESVNRLLDQWLKEVRARTRIVFMPEAFK